MTTCFLEKYGAEKINYLLETIISLMAQGLTDESFRYHLMSAKENGITREEIPEIVTHAAFYCGWPKAWAVFRMAKEIWNEEQ